MVAHYESDRVTVHHGDCLDVLRELDTLEQMEMVRYMEPLGEPIGRPEAAESDREAGGV